MARGNETRTSCELSGPDFLCQESEVEQSLMSQPSVSQPVGESQLPEEKRKRCTDSIHQKVALCPNHRETKWGKRTS